MVNKKYHKTLNNVSYVFLMLHVLSFLINKHYTFLEKKEYYDIMYIIIKQKTYFIQAKIIFKNLLPLRNQYWSIPYLCPKAGQHFLLMLRTS